MNTLNSNLLKKIFHMAGPYCLSMTATNNTNKILLEESKFNKYRFLKLTNRVFNSLFEKENLSLKSHTTFDIYSLKENETAICSIAKAYATWDLVKAFALASMIQNQTLRVKTFSEIKKELKKLAKSNPDQALTFVDCFQDDDSKREILAFVTKSLAVTNLGIALTCADYEIVSQDTINLSISEALSSFDPRSAIKALEFVTYEGYKLNPLLSIAKAFAKIDPYQSLKVANEALLIISKDQKKRIFKFIKIIEIYAILEFTYQNKLPDDSNTRSSIETALTLISKDRNKLQFMKELALTLSPWPELALEVANRIYDVKTQFIVFLEIADSLNKLSMKESAANLAIKIQKLANYFKDDNLRDQSSLHLGKYHFDLAIKSFDHSYENTLIFANILMKSGDQCNLKKLVDYKIKDIETATEPYLLSMAEAAAQAKIKPEDNFHLKRLLELWSTIDSEDDFSKGITLIQRACRLKFLAPQKAQEFADSGLEYLNNIKPDFEMNMQLLIQAGNLAEIDIDKAKELGDRALTSMLEALPQKFDLNLALKRVAESIHLLDFKKVQIFVEKTVENYQQLALLSEIALNALNS